MSKLFKCDACQEVQQGDSHAMYCYSTNSEGKRVVRTADLDLSCFEALRSMVVGSNTPAKILWIEKIVERRRS